MERLAGRVAVVTGAGSGIGRAAAVALAERGCRVAVADIDEDALAATVAALPGSAGATAHRVDVADEAGVAAVADEVVAAHGACHVVVANAGVATTGSFAETPVEDLRWIVDVNLWGVVNVVRSFLPHLRAAGEGHVVTVASMVALVGLPQHAAYSLTKGAVRAFSEALRGEARRDGIGVTCVLPGVVRTNIMGSARGPQAERLAALSRSRLASVAMLPPEAVGRRIVRAIERDQPRAVVGPDARVLDVASRILPSRSSILGRAARAIER